MIAACLFDGVLSHFSENIAMGKIKKTTARGAPRSSLPRVRRLCRLFGRPKGILGTPGWYRAGLDYLRAAPLHINHAFVLFLVGV
jgi:hypothetical protein